MKEPKVCPANRHPWTSIKWKQVQTMSAGMFVRVTGVVVDAECSACRARVVNGRITIPDEGGSDSHEPKKKAESVRRASKD